jgi:hypothetical protein
MIFVIFILSKMTRISLKINQLEFFNLLKNKKYNQAKIQPSEFFFQSNSHLFYETLNVLRKRVRGLSILIDRKEFLNEALKV